MPRLLLPLALLVAVAALLLPAAASAKPIPWKACAAPAAYPSPGGNPAGKLKALGAKGATCVKSQAVAIAYTKCRLANGAQGRCVKKVLGYSCRETRANDPVGGMSGQVTCSKDGASVRHSYEQDPAA